MNPLSWKTDLGTDHFKGIRPHWLWGNMSPISFNVSIGHKALNPCSVWKHFHTEHNTRLVESNQNAKFTKLLVLFEIDLRSCETWDCLTSRELLWSLINSPANFLLGSPSAGRHSIYSAPPRSRTGQGPCSRDQQYWGLNLWPSN